MSAGKPCSSHMQRADHVGQFQQQWQAGELRMDGKTVKRYKPTFPIWVGCRPLLLVLEADGFLGRWIWG